jgi:hypothetical protein
VITKEFTIFYKTYYFWEIKARIIIAKEVFNRKISLLTSKLNSRKNWLGVMFGALHAMAQRSGHYENWSGTIWRTLKCGAGGEWRR